MITEEAIPTYQTMLNTLDGVRDETGATPTPWAIWTRAWTAEENRHGDLLNKYFYLTGRVDMRQIENTIQYLIGSGMDTMRKKITMPAHLMFEGKDENLFAHYSSVAQCIGVYTVKDYADILMFLVSRWNLEKLKGVSWEGNKALDYECRLPSRIRTLEERAQDKAKQGSSVPFTRIFDIELAVYKWWCSEISVQNSIADRKQLCIEVRVMYQASVFI